MRRPVTAVASAAASVVVAAGLVSGTAGSALADLPVPTVPVPSVSVPSVPLPTGTPVPSVTVPAVPVPSPSVPGGGGGGGGGGNDGGPGGAGGGAGGGVTPGSSTTGGAQDATAVPGGASKAARAKAERRKADATPMIVGTGRERGLVDDEASPELRRASERFLAADRGIAEIARQKRVMARLKQDAAATAQLYRAMGYDVAGAERAAAAWHARYAALGTDAAVAERRLVEDSATRADQRLGGLVVARAGVKADFARIAARYEQAKRDLADANARIAALAAQRSSALTAVRAAQGSDEALNQIRLAQSGQLGTQIESLSLQLAERGDTVQGTGNLADPLDGTVTSPFGMRFHPVLRYTKLHTGTDYAGGSVIRAADDGRVLMTVVNPAYGNFTVIDHGVVDGKRLTTAYAHQARFLVRPGDAVAKGDPIGIVGQTGFSTGPHLHFEVRVNGAVIDPESVL